MVTIKPIPQIDHVVEGVINVHGAPVPVINLRRYLGLSPTPLQLHTPIILAQIDDPTALPNKSAGQQIVGLLVDEVLDVLGLPTDEINSVASILPEGLDRAPILLGLAQTQAGIALVLDLGYLFSTDQAKALAQAIAALSEKWTNSPPEAEKGANEPDMRGGHKEGEFRP